MNGNVIHIQPIGYRTDLRGLPEERCPQTKKRRFASREHAERQAAEWAQQNRTRAYGYQCQHCDGWHLTRSSRESSVNHAITSSE